MISTADYTRQFEFGELYSTLREKESRTYTDTELAMLPAIHHSHPRYKEWVIRRRSSEKLAAYIRHQKKQLEILEIGCGNGWLCNQLAKIPVVNITGSDINLKELQQAKRVFKDNDRLRFIHGDVESQELKDRKFDVIVLAACIQYFPSVPYLLHKLFQLLNEEGEIHILDSPFYKEGEAVNARERTNAYYHRMGFPGMSSYYFHHEITELTGLNHRFLYQPSFILSFFTKYKNPFPWIIIKNEMVSTT